MIEQQTIQDESSLNRKQVIRRLCSKTPALQKEIERKLIAQDNAGLEVLLDILRQEARKRQTRLSLAVIVGLAQMGIGTALGIFVMSILLHLFRGDTSPILHHHSLRWILFFTLPSYALSCLFMYLCFPITRLEKRAAQALVHFDDVRAIGPLISAYMSTNHPYFFLGRQS